jgi:hypothetical protein
LYLDCSKPGLANKVLFHFNVSLKKKKSFADRRPISPLGKSIVDDNSFHDNVHRLLSVFHCSAMFFQYLQLNSSGKEFRSVAFFFVSYVEKLRRGNREPI